MRLASPRINYLPGGTVFWAQHDGVDRALKMYGFVAILRRTIWPMVRRLMRCV